MAGHDRDGNEPLFDAADGASALHVYGENGLVHIEMRQDVGLSVPAVQATSLSEAECRKLAAVLIRLADIWCVS
jgi:hypothetical protein